jgi:hypothetical protein
MLEAIPNPGTAFPRLRSCRRVYRKWVEAWIVHKEPDRAGGIDWQLWIERKGRMTTAKCPLRLEIESRLRSWLLRVSGMPLNTLTFTQLRLITEGKISEARRLHVRGLDTLMHRLGTTPIPTISDIGVD